MRASSSMCIGSSVSALTHARELGLTRAARMAIKPSGTKAALDIAAAMAAEPDEAQTDD